LTALPLDRESIKAEFQRERGYWRPWTETLLRERPQFLQTYAKYAGHPARTGPLSARMVELIYVALDASSTHLFEPGLHTHMEKALEVGATRHDIFDVLHLVAAQGLECVLQGAKILAEETGHAMPTNPADHPQQDWDWLLEHDPAYVQVVRDFLDAAATPQGLTQAERCLIQIALHACFTAFNPVSLREQIQHGLKSGLESSHMLQAIQLGAHLSVHGTALGARVYEALT
jgi:alkylhydroperoxidase/carboxymuconolactone decarboxylase family protein YurZ